nr:hypothetical protein [Candidatus Reidiella endopervernicosa]
MWVRCGSLVLISDGLVSALLFGVIEINVDAMQYLLDIVTFSVLCDTDTEGDVFDPIEAMVSD